jgi:hypothetical protein
MTLAGLEAQLGDAGLEVEAGVDDLLIERLVEVQVSFSLTAAKNCLVLDDRSPSASRNCPTAFLARDALEEVGVGRTRRRR